MKKYLGVKIVEAEPAWKAFDENRRCKIYPKSTYPKPQNAESGYKVMCGNASAWFSDDDFEKTYKELQEQDLGLSIVFLNTVSGNWRYSFEGEDTGANFNDEENLKRFCIGKALRLQGVTSKSELLEAAKEIYNWIKE